MNVAKCACFQVFTLILTASLILPARGVKAQGHGSQLLPHVIDSILHEGLRIYQYEKAAWVSSDRALVHSMARDSFSEFIVYEAADTLKAIYVCKDRMFCLYELWFYHDFQWHEHENLEKRLLSDHEKDLFKVRDRIIDYVITNQLDIHAPEGYSLNLVLMPDRAGYKLYILTGAFVPDVIPFGNDYLFLADQEGKVNFWKKFHSRLIPQEVKGPDGETVEMLMHSHIRSEPYITATDIATFRLYGPYYGLNEFSVYSPELQKVFKYSMDKHAIELQDRP